MGETTTGFKNGEPLVIPGVAIGIGVGGKVSDLVTGRIMRAVIDRSLHLPAMFEIVFDDNDGDTLEKAKIEIGSELTISAGAPDAVSASPLVSGEVTTIEGSYDQNTWFTVVRGYDKMHRLQRSRRTRTFVNMKDCDIVRQVLSQAGLTPGTIEETKTTHTHLGQVDQTDWDFLQMRAREIGYEFGIDDGKVYFRRASSATGGTGAAISLTLEEKLLEFNPRVSGGNLAPDVEVRVWDSVTRKVVATQHPITTKSATLSDADPEKLANSFSGGGVAAPPPPPPPPAVGTLGPAPSDKAFVVNTRPVASGASINAALDEVVSGVADHLASSFASAEGVVIGDPQIMPGQAVAVDGAPGPFNGTWMVTSARHVFDPDEGGYRTHFRADGRQDRSLLNLASAGSATDARPRPNFPGVCCGVVTNNNDPAKQGNVKVVLPWLSPQYETDWAPVVQFGAGPKTGAMFLPEVGDEVLVGFEFGDPRRPYVFGGLLTDKSTYSLGGPAVKPSGMAASVVRRGFVSPAGNRLMFNDELPPGGAAGPPLTSTFSLGTGDEKIAFVIDQVAGTVTLVCKPTPPESKSPEGRITIECADLGTVNVQTGNAGTINIKAGEGGSVNVDGGAKLSMKAQAMVEIESEGEVSIKGSLIKLN